MGRFEISFILYTGLIYSSKEYLHVCRNNLLSTLYNHNSSIVEPGPFDARK
jgi:hypothetical protein